MGLLSDKVVRGLIGEVMGQQLREGQEVLYARGLRLQCQSTQCVSHEIVVGGCKLSMTMGRHKVAVCALWPSMADSKALLMPQLCRCKLQPQCCTGRHRASGELDKQQAFCNFSCWFALWPATNPVHQALLGTNVKSGMLPTLWQDTAVHCAGMENMPSQ